MEEGNGMKQDGIILCLMYQNWWCLIKPHLLQPTSITSHSSNFHHGPYMMGFSIKVQINYYATICMDVTHSMKNIFSEDNQMNVFELFQKNKIILKWILVTMIWPPCYHHIKYSNTI
jgi:hypothetical protein